MVFLVNDSEFNQQMYIHSTTENNNRYLYFNTSIRMSNFSLSWPAQLLFVMGCRPEEKKLTFIYFQSHIKLLTNDSLS